MVRSTNINEIILGLPVNKIEKIANIIVVAETLIEFLAPIINFERCINT